MSTLVFAGGWLVAALAAFELRRRERLLRDAVHELRGPVGALSLGLELLRRQPVSRRRAEALLTELMRAHAAVDDVAAAARGKRATGRAESVQLGSLVGRVSAAWAAVAERAGRRLRFEWEAGPAAVRADRRRLAQAFGNLLANAVEHGDGDIVVRGTEADCGVRVEIANAGAAHTGGSTPGRGRGLVIAERVLEADGGRLETTELPEGGRVASVELPLEPAA